MFRPYRHSSGNFSFPVVALNLFLRYIDGPANPQGLAVPLGIHAHFSGIDLVRDSLTGGFLVREDDVRTPSRIE